MSIKSKSFICYLVYFETSSSNISMKNNFIKIVRYLWHTLYIYLAREETTLVQKARSPLMMEIIGWFLSQSMENFHTNNFLSITFYSKVAPKKDIEDKLSPWKIPVGPNIAKEETAHIQRAIYPTRMKMIVRFYLGLSRISQRTILSL